MLKTELLGDPETCRQTGEWLKQVSARVFDAATTLEWARIRRREACCEDTPGVLEEQLGRGRQEADQLSVEIERAAFGLIAFANELDTVAALMLQARAAAVAAGLTVIAQVIEPPLMVHAEQLLAWQEIYQVVSFARGLEMAAHERLATVVAVGRKALENLRGEAGFIAGGAAGLAEGPAQPNSGYRTLARRYARESLELTRRFVDHPRLATPLPVQPSANRGDYHLGAVTGRLAVEPAVLVDGSGTPVTVGVSAAAARGVGYEVERS